MRTLRDRNTFQDLGIKTETIFDGLGREKERRTYQNPTVCAIYDLIETQHDALGREWKTSNPRCSGSSADWTFTTYDNLGRVLSTTQPGSAVTSFGYSGGASGIVTRRTDPADNVVETAADAFGRIAQVTEYGRSPDPNYLTTYAWNSLQPAASLPLLYTVFTLSVFVTK